MKSSNIYILISVIVLINLVTFLNLKKNNRQCPDPNISYNRIVSLAPNITEILFSLDLGGKIVGVSEFSNYPPAAQQIPKVGALLNPNFEAIIAQKPDLIIMPREMADYKSRFESLGIQTLIIKHDSIDEILDAINEIGNKCGKSEQAQKIVEDLKSKIRQIQTASQNQIRPRVLISLGHDYSQETLAKPQNISIAGNDGFYSQMIQYAGGKNVYTGMIKFPVVSWESVVSMNPQIIIDIAPVETKPMDVEITIKQWKNFAQVDAAKNNRIYVFTEDYTAIPGPRFILTLEKIARIIHINEPNSNSN